MSAGQVGCAWARSRWRGKETGMGGVKPYPQPQLQPPAPFLPACISAAVHFFQERTAHPLHLHSLPHHHILAQSLSAH